MNNTEDKSRWQAPPDYGDAHTEGYEAFYATNPTFLNYLDIEVKCPDYAPGSIHYVVFYQGVCDARRNYEKGL